MPYVVPQFPLFVGLYKSTSPGSVLFDAVGMNYAEDIPANLTWGRRTMVPFSGGTGQLGYAVAPMTLLVPFEVDQLRGFEDTEGPCFVRVSLPGKDIYYAVLMWDYIGLGFANQHIGAVLLKCPRQFTNGV